MPQHREAKVLPYGPKQMFDLVADVGRYPEFLPWNSAARIRSRHPIDGGEVLEADLVISFKVFREKFGSRVTLLPGQGDGAGARILTEYIDGPFKHLKSVWGFLPHPTGCEIRFDVDFEFRNAILGSVIGLVFNEAMSRVVRAFEARAKDIYGPPKA
jgi:coenzyme Q-binding protein COQ10